MRDEEIICDNPVQLLCDVNMINGRDGNVHEFEHLHVLEEGRERNELRKEAKSDQTLKESYNETKQGNTSLEIADGLLVKNVHDKTGDPMQVIAVPTSLRRKILDLAHEGSRHMGVKECLSLIASKFIWPGMKKYYISLQCKSCQICQKCGKNGPRKAPLVIQPIFSISFEPCTSDFVDSLQKARDR